MSMSKGFTLILILILAVSSLIMVKPAFAQSIPMPSVPEFTLSLVSRPNEIVAPTTIIHFENKSIDVTIENQPFSSYNIIAEHTAVNLWYQIQFKGYNGTDWQLYSDSMITPIYFTYFTIQSTSNYTVISVPVNSDQAHVGSVTNFPEGSQVDFQVRALIGQPFVDEQGGGYVPFFKGETGNWSNIQTITIGEISTSPSPTPTPAVPEFPAGMLAILTLSIAVTVSCVVMVSMQLRQGSCKIRSLITTLNQLHR